MCVQHVSPLSECLPAALVLSVSVLLYFLSNSSCLSFFTEVETKGLYPGSSEQNICQYSLI